MFVIIVTTTLTTSLLVTTCWCITCKFLLTYNNFAKSIKKELWNHKLQDGKKS